MIMFTILKIILRRLSFFLCCHGHPIQLCLNEQAQVGKMEKILLMTSLSFNKELLYDENTRGDVFSPFEIVICSMRASQLLLFDFKKLS